MNFESVYDFLMDEEVYEQWFSYASSFFNRQDGPLLDLACGSGALTLRLASAGFDMIGLDLSEAMLSQAQMAAQDQQLSLPFIQGDMRDLSALTRVAGVLCSLDALCYLPYLEDVLMVFEQVYDLLDEGAYFLFDVHSTYKMEEIFYSYHYNYAAEDWVFTWESFQADEEYSVIHQLDLFNKEDDGSYQRLSRNVYQWTHPYERYLQLLKHVGFQDINISSDFGKSDDLSQAERWFFACQK